MNSARPHLQLEAGHVHVWWIDLTRVTEGDAVLSAEEHARAARFRQSHDRRRWIAAHVALRQILSHHTEISPAALRLTIRAQGKPALLDEPSLRFNLSHAGERAALAVAWQREVGIDLEPLADGLTGRQNLETLMAFACTPAEAASIESLPPADRDEAFLTLWTLKEAYLKGIGVGLTVEPRNISLTPNPCSSDPHPPAPRLLPKPPSTEGGVSHCGEERGGRDVGIGCQRQLISMSTLPSPSALGEGLGVRDLVGEGPGLREHPWTLRLLNPGPGWVAALAVAGAQSAITDRHWPLDSRV